MALAAVAACANPQPARGPSRLESLAEAFRTRASDPKRSLGAFAAAGAGTTLERARVTAWLQELESVPSPPVAWRRLLAEHPPAAVEGRARIGLARALAASGQIGAAVSELETVDGEGRIRADAALVELAEGTARGTAARHLAIFAPAELHRLDPELEARVLAGLTAHERLQRSVRWRAVGRPERAIAELRRLRFQGEEEHQRRLEMARSEIAAGSPKRALGVLPRPAARDPDVLLLRASALRRMAWQRVPRSSARGAFRDCLTAARQAARDGQTAAADELVLECGTEAGVLEEALAAWRRLEADGWADGRREWLGRRLGVALARADEDLGAVRGLAAAMPTQRRCLEYWIAVAEGEGGHERLRELSRASFSDLYGQWARRALGGGEPQGVRLPPDLVLDAPPQSVQWLLDWGATGEAADQWRWIGDVRGLRPGEGLAASELARGLGRQHTAISWLVKAFPDLGTVAMDRAPGNAVRAYLPLRWRSALVAAATENGIEPWLLAALARQESAFVPHARSPRGALGILQLLPGTARGHARALGLGTRPDLFDPETNLRLGARELASLVAHFNAVEPALAAYNAGRARVDGWWRAWPDRERFTEAIPIPESYNYVRRVTYLAEAYRIVYADDWRTAS
jgi:hypothetical protein